ncbi:Ferric reductase like transmembrane component [Ceratobasidium sp. AG-Ba]|nr:Ferric reductase like transmembrane component [Ceratobasidium sp. AG-Ba]
MMIGVWKHQPTVAVPYVATCMALYGADQLARLAKSRLRKAILTPVPELGCTHVYIRMSTKAGPLANMSGSEFFHSELACLAGPRLTVYGLYRMASDKSKEGDHRNVYVLVEGPYGGPGNTVIPSFSGVMLVLGGSGITFGTSVLEDIIAKSLDGAARTLCVYFVWVVQHPSAADPHLSSFVEIVQRAAAVPNLKLTLSVFYTRGSDKAFALRTRLPPNIQIRSGRPDLGKELEEVLRVTRMSIISTQASKGGVILAGCGPEGLISNIYTAKAEASTQAQREVGGLELHTETFGW